MTRTQLSAKDLLMRFTPFALALSLVAVSTSSVLHSSSGPDLDPRAAALVSQSHALIAAGNVNEAIGALESALTLAPANVEVLLALAAANRLNGMQGKALHYYREALQGDPRNLAAIAGEGEALAEKGATEKANRNLARLKGLCGTSCDETQQLSAAIQRGPAKRMVSAEAVTPKPVVQEN
ncbi:tetratricopeptide repeat protein [Novosphingobium aquimarinum]|uniref:tetratricopeptide repeat protein n=1 Tax=Novosphingobium aquimarinum TaxID=2682494 RepID=UPI0012EB9A45|nr:tetratricopeptide repeat protein [Novosphingobium aquimarinum]